MKQRVIQLVPYAGRVPCTLDALKGLCGGTRDHAYDGRVTQKGFNVEKAASKYSGPIRIAVEHVHGYLPGQTHENLVEALASCHALPHAAPLHIVYDELQIQEGTLEMEVRDRIQVRRTAA